MNDLLTMGLLQTVGLVALRCVVMIETIAALSPYRVPVVVRSAVALLLTFFATLAWQSGELALFSGPLWRAVPVEISLGVVLGLVTFLPLEAVRVAAVVMDMQIGYRAPQPGPLQRCAILLAGCGFFAINAHHAMIEAFARSFAAFPPGNADALVVNDVVSLFSEALILGVLLGLPVIAAVLLMDLAALVVDRAAPAFARVLATPRSLVALAVASVVLSVLLDTELPEFAVRALATLTQVSHG